MFTLTGKRVRRVRLVRDMSYFARRRKISSALLPIASFAKKKNGKSYARLEFMGIVPEFMSQKRLNSLG